MKCKKCKCEKGEECFRAKRAKKLCKLCDRCRNFADARGRKYVAKDPVGYRQKQKDWMLTEKAIESHRRDLAAQKTTEARAQKAELQRSWRQTDNGKKYLQSDGYKESKKREYEKLMSKPGAKTMHYVQVALSDATHGRHDGYYSTKIVQYTEFANLEDLKKFFSERWEDGMSWENHSHTGWNIGHRIAKDHYDFSNDEDVRRCWKKVNLFPQWATGAGGNCSLKTKFPSEEELLALRCCWPTNWNDDLPSQAVRVEMEERCNKKCA